MTINWYGNSCFRISSNGTSLIINPPAKVSGLKRPKGTHDIVLFSGSPVPKADWSGALKPETRVISSPGEYDVGNFFIFAMAPSSSSSDQERIIDEAKMVGTNEVAIIVLEQNRKTVCHIANYPFPRISDKDLEQIGNVDVLMVPVGEPGGKTAGFSAEKAARITKQIEPSVVIPMRYALKGLKEELEDPSKFLKEMGQNGTEPQAKMNIKKNEVFSKEGTNAILLAPTI